MSNFKAENIKKYKELFSISVEIEEMAEKMRNSFNEASLKNDFRRSKMPLYKTIFLFFINSAMRQYPSIHILCADGYAHCASPILRSLWENLVSIKYILINSKGQLDEKEANLKAERFEEYRWINMSKMLRYWKTDQVQRQDLQENIISKSEEILRQVGEFKKKFKAKNLTSWSGISIEEMAEKMSMIGDYDLVYRLCCALSHPSTLGFQLNVTKNPETTIFSTKPSDDQVASVLMISMTYFHEFLVLFDHVFSLDMLNNLTVFQNKAKSIFDQINSQ